MPPVFSVIARRVLVPTTLAPHAVQVSNLLALLKFHIECLPEIASGMIETKRLNH